MFVLMMMFVMVGFLMIMPIVIVIVVIVIVMIVVVMIVMMVRLSFGNGRNRDLKLIAVTNQADEPVIRRESSAFFVTSGNVSSMLVIIDSSVINAYSFPLSRNIKQSQMNDHIR